jgi:hypothetical protein
MLRKRAISSCITYLELLPIPKVLGGRLLKILVLLNDLGA